MIFERDVPLAPLTTFGIGGPATLLCHVASVPELKKAVQYGKSEGYRILPMGGGSNVLIGDAGFDGLVLRIEIPGLDMKTDHESVLVVAGAGILWDDLVSKTIDEGLWGLENLSGIPGTVGATPIQNIGAYGKEIASVIEWIEAYDQATGKTRRLSPMDCRFGYRESIFKMSFGASFIITRVAYRLSKKGTRNIEYKDLKAYFGLANNPTLHEIRHAVLEIRGRKFPSPNEYGTAGSFFKNPTVSHERARDLKREYPELPIFPMPTNGVKISAAWLIDHVAQMRGYAKGKVRTFPAQALVLIAEKGATARDVLALADEIKEKIYSCAGIELEMEVQRVSC